MISNLEKRFFKTFNIKPATNSCKDFSQKFKNLLGIGRSNYPTFTSDIVIKLEQVLLQWKNRSEVTIIRENKKYIYILHTSDNSGDAYYRCFDMGQNKTRLDALLELLIRYHNNEYIYKSVQEVFNEQ